MEKTIQEDNISNSSINTSKEADIEKTPEWSNIFKRYSYLYNNQKSTGFNIIKKSFLYTSPFILLFIPLILQLPLYIGLSLSIILTSWIYNAILGYYSCVYDERFLSTHTLILSGVISFIIMSALVLPYMSVIGLIYILMISVNGVIFPYAFGDIAGRDV